VFHHVVETVATETIFFLKMSAKKQYPRTAPRSKTRVGEDGKKEELTYLTADQADKLEHDSVRMCLNESITTQVACDRRKRITTCSKQHFEKLSLHFSGNSLTAIKRAKATPVN
jgi:hypothetical protein